MTHDPFACTECDEGYVEYDVARSDHVGAAKVECPKCLGTLRRLCSYCETNNATMVDEFSDPVCEVCNEANN